MRERFISVLIPAQTEELQKPQEITLTESLGEKDLPLRRRQAKDLIDKMEISLEQKRLLFFYHLWHETGSFGPIKEFGDIREDPTVFSMLDRVMESDELVLKYEDFYAEYKSLTQQEQQREVKKKIVVQEKPGKKLVKMLEKGIIVENAIKELEIPALLEEKGETAKERFAQFCGKVELINDPMLSDKDIASALHSTESRVKRARKRLRESGKARKRTPKEVSRANSRRLIPLRNKVKEMVPNNFLSDISEKTGATISQVKHQKKLLVRSGEISKNPTRTQNRERLRKIINDYMVNKKGQKINLSRIHRESGLGLSYSTIQSLYHEIDSEQEVPKLG